MKRLKDRISGALPPEIPFEALFYTQDLVVLQG